MGKKSRAKSKPSKTTSCREERYKRKGGNTVEENENEQGEEGQPKTAALSDELLAELGMDSIEDAVITVSKKKKQLKQPLPHIYKDIDIKERTKLMQKDAEEQKKLSKRARRRMEQWAAKQEREEKRSEYIQKLQEHAISSEQQQLLTSTKLIGQTLSLKQRLRVLHKRHKAGLTLSQEEMNLLFPYGHKEANTDVKNARNDENDSDSDDDEDNDGNECSDEEEVKKYSSENDSRNNELDSNDFDSRFGPLGKQIKADEKRTQLSSKPNQNAGEDDRSGEGGQKHDARPTPITAWTSSSMSSFMENFQKLKAEKNKADTSKFSSAQEEQYSVLNRMYSNDDDGDDAGNKKRKYIPQPLELPTDNSGNIRRLSSLSGQEGQEDQFISEEESIIRNRNYVSITRTEEVQASRMQLPVCKMEQEVVEAVNENDVIIICGETGSGKSTQLPQFMYEAGYGKHGLIGITQPRRVAATSTADRVAFELVGGVCTDRDDGGLVGYQIRYDSSTVGKNTVVKFMTDGILLREITNDLLLRKYSVVILDEAHERNVNTDILLGMISRAVPLRRRVAEEETKKWNKLSDEDRNKYLPPLKPLKVVIMSATLRVDDFRSPSLFTPIPKLIMVEARQYPITTHFARVTEIENYLEATYQKIVNIHQKQSYGGILVFLTGKKEIKYMCKRLNKELNGDDKMARKDLKNSLANSVETGQNGKEFDRFLQGLDEEEIDGDVLEDITNKGDDDKDSDSDSSEDDDCFGSGRDKKGNENNHKDDEDKNNNNNNNDDDDDDDDKDDDDEVRLPADESDTAAMTREAMLREALGLPTLPTNNEEREKILTEEAAAAATLDPSEPERPRKARVLPLFAMLDSEAQAKVFGDVPKDTRLVVVSTNVAETSITIPGIRYVVDCGRQKEKVVTKGSSIASFQVKWISKASAEQRKGRAGRTGPGHCYRLYSSAFFDQHMQMYQEPEITRIPLEDLLLQMRTMGIEKLEDFPFPTTPSRAVLEKALSVLTNLGAMKLVETIPTLAWLYRQDAKKKQKTELIASNKVTALGVTLSKFPINPRYAKILSTAHKTSPKILPYAILLVAVMSERSPFLPKRRGEDENEEYTNNKDEDIDSKDLSLHNSSDVLARLRAFGSYLYASKIMRSRAQTELDIQKEFCSIHFLHRDTLEKIRDLRRQLAVVCKAQFTLDEDDARDLVSDELPPPTIVEEKALRQILMTGFCDSIAKRAPAGSIPTGSRRRRLTAYFTCDSSINVPLYIHPESSLYNTDPTASLPEYVVYNDLLMNNAGDVTYMVCVTEIHENWISHLTRDCPLLQWSAPLVSPTPYYENKKDEVMCYSVPKYGSEKWELPPVKISMLSLQSFLHPTASTKLEGQMVGYRSIDEHARWFVRLLLEGNVLPELKMVLKSEFLKVKPSAITQKQPNATISSLLQQIISSNVKSKQDFIASVKDCIRKSKKDRDTISSKQLFLCDELQQFLSSEHRKKFREVYKRMCFSFQTSDKGR